MKNTGVIDHRAIHMVDEMLHYLYRLKGDNIKTEIHLLEDRTIMEFRTKTFVLDDREMYDLTQSIKAPRLHELEEYYWALSGNELGNNNEMTLVGMMTDDSEIKYDKESGDLYIKLVRLD